jgi:type 1 glutamine amidotransferase
VNAGGHVLGIHAASDTYRHSTANGANTGTWDFYAELIGASVQQGPNHVDGTPPYALSHIGMHASTANLPDPWVKHEEYYYWEGGFFAPGNQVVLEVEATIGPNGQVNSYDAPRPVSWYRVLPTGTRVFYTALGHATSDYTDDALFRQHIGDALLWSLNGTTGIGSHSPVPTIRAYPNPAADRLIIEHGSAMAGSTVHILNAVGAPVLQVPLTHERTTVDLRGLGPGPYLLSTADGVLPVWIVR